MKFNKMILISLILVILSISCVSANEFTNEDIQSDLSDIDNQLVLSNDSNQYVQEAYLENSDMDNNMDVNYNHDSELTDDFDGNYESIDLDKESNQNTKALNSNQLGSNQQSIGNTYIVSSANYSKYFDKNGLLKEGVVSDYDTLDLSGKFINKNFIFTTPHHITSSNGAKLTNCMIKFENMTASGRSSVSNLYIRNSEEWVAGVYILNSTNVDVYGNDIYCTGANGNPVRVIYSNYSSIFNNRLETNFTGYMNLSWKRAGILLGDSHYNNIYSNDVTIKDSNPIYLTTYGFEKSNYNVIFNNTVRSSAISEDSGLSNPSAWAYGIHLMGDYNLALNNTIHNVYRGIDSEGSFNVLAGNIIFNLTGGYYEGNDGTEGGDYGIHASYDNIIANNTIFDSKLTGSAIYLMPNNTAYGNIVYNISGHCGLEFNNFADNCHVYGNVFDVPVSNPVYIYGRMNNLTLENNILSGIDATAIQIKKQSNSKYPTNITISNNLIMGYGKTFNQSPIDYSQISSDANIVSFNNSIVVYNETFFNYFDENGKIKNLEDWDYLINSITYQDSYNYNSLVFAGNFSSLTEEIVLSDNMVALKAFVGNRISSLYRENDYDQYVQLYKNLEETYMVNTLFKNVYMVLNGSDLTIDSFSFNYTNPDINPFVIDGANNVSIKNNDFYFVSSSSDYNLVFINNASSISFFNNTFLVDSANYALVINNSDVSIVQNNITINANHSAILNLDESNVNLKDNEINAFNDGGGNGSGSGIIDDGNGSTELDFYIVNDENYLDFFNEDGSFRDDFEIESGNALILGNLTNKTFIIDILLNITSLDEDGKLINCFISLEGESSNSNITNLTFEFNGSPDRNPFAVDGVENVSIENNDFHFVFQSPDDTLNASDYDLIFINNASGINFFNNTVLVDSLNFALVINNSNISIVQNNITINSNHSAILNVNQSNVILDDNEIKTLFEETSAIDNVNSTVPKPSYYIVNDTNYLDYFNEDGSFRDDFEIEFGNTLKLANLTNKTLIVDIPLKIISLGEEYKLLNSFISLEGESSNSNVSNIKFELTDNFNSDSVDFISIKDGVSNLKIYNNSFLFDSNKDPANEDSLNDLGDGGSLNGLSAIGLYGDDYISQDILIENNSIAFKGNSQSNLTFYGIRLSNRNEFFNFKTHPTGFIIRNNNISIENGFIKAISLDSVNNILLEGNLFNLSSNNSNLSSNNSSAIAIDSNKANNLTISKNVFSILSDYLACGINSTDDYNISLDSNQFLIDSPLAYGINVDDGSKLNVLNNKFSIASSDVLYGVNLADAYQVSLINNGFALDSSDMLYGVNLDGGEYLSITNNDFSDESANELCTFDLKNSRYLSIQSNNILSVALNSISIELSNASDFNIVNNVINNDFAYDNIENAHFGSSSSAILVNDYIEDNLIKEGFLLINEINGTLEENLLYENDLQCVMVHSLNNTKDLQNLIDYAQPNDVVDLGTRIYDNLDTLRIDKNITINGGIFISNNNWKPLFEILDNSSLFDALDNSSFEMFDNSRLSDALDNSSHYESFNYVNIKNGQYYLNNADLLVLLNGYNGTDVLSIEVPEVNISNNSFSLLNGSIVPESINILKLISNRSILSTSNGISIENNTLAIGMNPFKFEVIPLMQGSDIDIGPESEFSRKASRIIFENMETTAFQSAIDGRVGKYFEVVLKDEKGNVLSDKFIQIGFNGRIYNRTTNENGSARLQINLGYSGIYTFAISFLGDDDYNGSFEVAKITVNKQNPILTVSDKTYKASLKSKTLQASLKSIYGNPIKFKKVSFVINGKTYAASTDSNGIASVKVSLSSKKTYKFTVKSTADGTYNAVSKSAKLIIK